MGFAQIANGLLKQQAIPINGAAPKVQGRADIMMRLDNAGFSIEEVFRDLKELYNETEEDHIKRGILSDILKVRGLMQAEGQKIEAPQIIINVAGDNVKVQSMLCPQTAELEYAQLSPGTD